MWLISDSPAYLAKKEKSLVHFANGESVAFALDNLKV
jgi:hypothetical protein